MGGKDRYFPTTLWSMVLGAGRGEAEKRRANLETLIRLYWKPAFLYLRAVRRGIPVEAAKDLTQEFFTHLLEKDAFERLSPDRGTFRGFLKQALRNFTIDAGRRERARRPPAGHVLFRLEEMRDREDVPQADPDTLFEQEWNRTVLFSSLRELEERLGARGLSDHFEIFRRYCLPQDRGAESNALRAIGGKTYQAIADEMGLTEPTVRTRLASCRAELREIMKAKIREYAADEEEAREEYRRIVGE